jgi:hypothetical protein
MPLQLPGGDSPAAARQRLAASLAALQRQYKGTGLGHYDPSGQWRPNQPARFGETTQPDLGALVPSDEDVMNPVFKKDLAALEAGGPARDWNAFNPDDWLPSGVNRYNQFLGGRDPNAPPGPVGRGPGFWFWDAWGGQWRSDWEQRGGQWFIKGEQ